VEIRALLEQLEDVDDPAAPLVYLAAQWVEVDPVELHAARRRALLLLATGGDPRRGLEPDGRAVRALAADLDAPEPRAQLARALGALRGAADGLPRVSAVLDALSADSDDAWRWLACALLAEELAEAGEAAPPSDEGTCTSSP